MKVTAIKESVNKSGSIDVVVNIEHKQDLILNFQGVTKLLCLNDCMFLTLFIQSMAEGTTISMPDEFPISEVLVANMKKLQPIFSQWFPKLLQEIEIDVSTHQVNAAKSGCFSLFSGGVDSFYTFLENQNEISHVFLCIGMDIQLEEITKQKQAISQYQALAEHYGKKLLIASTNIRHVFPNANRSVQHAALFSALVLAYGLEKLFIPASHNINELFPWGSHMLTDPLMSNGITTVVHHGAVSRSCKTIAISEDKHALDSLRICNSSDELNCGECEKCLRTMFVLDALKCQSDNLPSLDLQLLSNIKIYTDSQFSFWQDNYQLAMEYGRLDLAKYAKKIMKSYEIRQWFKKGRQLFFGKA